MHPVLAVVLVFLVGFVLGIAFGKPVEVPSRRALTELQREGMPLLTIGAAFEEMLCRGEGGRAMCILDSDGRYRFIRESWTGAMGGMRVVFLD